AACCPPAACPPCCAPCCPSAPCSGCHCSTSITSTATARAVNSSTDRREPSSVSQERVANFPHTCTLFPGLRLSASMVGRSTISPLRFVGHTSTVIKCSAFLSHCSVSVL